MPNPASHNRLFIDAESRWRRWRRAARRPRLTTNPAQGSHNAKRCTKPGPLMSPFFVSFCLSCSKSGVNSAHFNDNRYRFTHLNATRISQLVISGRTNYMATENICRQLFCLFKSNANVHFITRRDACCFQGRRRCAESGEAFF